MLKFFTQITSKYVLLQAIILEILSRSDDWKILKFN